MRASAVTWASEISDSELARLTALLKSERLSGPHLEIGTAAGGTLKEMMRCYPDNRRPKFVVVDPMTYFDDQLRIVRDNLLSAGLAPGDVDFRLSKSWPAFKAAARSGETYSFMFIDGSHKIHHVTEDLAWTRLLQPGGFVCFHDYEPKFKGVMMAVDRFLARHSNYHVVDRVERLLIVRKDGASAEPEIGVFDRARARALNIHHQFQSSLRKRTGR